MANDNNLLPLDRRSKEQQREIQRRGGINSGKSRREKKAIRDILTDFLKSDISKQPQFNKIAAKIGIKSDRSIKELFTVICLLNSAKSGNLKDLETLAALIGEDGGATDNGILEELTEYLKPKKKK